MQGANRPVEKLRRSFDWRAAFETAFDGYWTGHDKPIPALNDVVRVVCCDDGENDEDNWVGVFELTGGRFLWISAGCDYTGWG